MARGLYHGVVRCPAGELLADDAAARQYCDDALGLRSFWVATVLVGVVACDKRTPEEKGKDDAEQKLGLREGAANVLEEKGKGLGQTVGKGVGEVVKGTGSGVKDVVHPPVTLEVASERSAIGIKVLQAHEGDGSGGTRGVVVYLHVSVPERHAAEQNEELRLHAGSTKTVSLDASLSQSGISPSQLEEQGEEVSVYAIFAKPFSGGLQLRAKSAEGTELGRSAATAKLTYAADSASYLSFKLDARTPFSNVTEYTLHSVAPAKPSKP